MGGTVGLPNLASVPPRPVFYIWEACLYVLVHVYTTLDLTLPRLSLWELMNTVLGPQLQSKVPISGSSK